MFTVRRIRVLGVLTMVAGSFLVPIAAHATPPTDDGHKVTICHRTNSVTNPYEVIEVDAASLEGDSQNPSDHSSHVGAPFDFDADHDVVYPTPRNGDQWGDIIPAFDFGTIAFEGLNWTDEGIAIHEAGCQAPPPPPETTLTITKVVDGDAAPTEWAYGFTTSVGDFELTDAAPSTDATDVVPDAEISVAEDDAGDATSTTIECTDAVAVPGDDGLSVTVTVAEGDAAVCTFTNTFEPEVVVETGSLTVTKAVTGEDPGTWSFPFDGAALGTFDLTDATPTAVFDELDAGVYAIDELDAGDAELIGIDCGDADVVIEVAEDGSTGSATVTLGEGDDVVCTFTNDFPEVLDETVVKTTTTEPEVLGSVVQAPTLPRTGAGDTILAVVGAMLLMAGSGLTFGARRIEARVAPRR